MVLSSNPLTTNKKEKEKKKPVSLSDDIEN
jgi:hypothetical protein